MQITDALDTRDVDEARTQLARSYCPHRMHLPGDGSGFRARHARVADSPIGIFRLGYGGDAVVLHPVPFRDFMLVSRPLAGAFEVRSRKQSLTVGPGESVALDPDSEHELRFGPSCRLLTIKVPTAALSTAGSADDTRPVTELTRDPTAWNAITRFLLTEAVPHGLLAENTIMQRHTVQLVAGAVLASFGRTPRTEIRETNPSPTAVRRALDYIDDHAHDDIGLLDIAAAAGLSPRGLQYAFRRSLGTTPLTHLRNTRLDLARRDLLTDDDRTVADIAYSYGFGNLGRFASDYRLRFGRLPRADRPRAAASPPTGVRDAARLRSAGS